MKRKQAPQPAPHHICPRTEPDGSVRIEDESGALVSYEHATRVPRALFAPYWPERPAAGTAAESAWVEGVAGTQFDLLSRLVSLLMQRADNLVVNYDWVREPVESLHKALSSDVRSMGAFKSLVIDQMQTCETVERQCAENAPDVLEEREKEQEFAERCGGSPGADMFLDQLRRTLNPAERQRLLNNFNAELTKLGKGLHHENVLQPQRPNAGTNAWG